MIQARIPQIRLHRRRVAKVLRNAIVRLNQISKWVRDTVIIMIAARLITYAAIFVNWSMPVFGNRIVDWFWCPDYTNPMKVKWWVKYFSSEIAWLLISYAFCKISLQVSNYLFLVSVIFLGYHIIDCLMFLWNFQRYDLFYVDLMWTTLTLIWTVFRGFRPEAIAKIKSLF